MYGEYSFKMVYTTYTVKYTSRTNIPQRDFFARMKINIAHDLDIVLGDFELVEAGQPDGERAAAVEYNNDTRTVFQRYSENAAFYIRHKNTLDTLTQNNETAESTRNFPTMECGVCSGTAETVHYQCSHMFCLTCIRSCNTYQITRCPMCRADQLPVCQY